MSLADTTILDAIAIPDLWRRWFRDPQTWASWFVFLKALFCLPMEEPEHRLFAACTGRERLPDEAGAKPG